MANNRVVYGNTVVMDITDTTATASDVASGKIFYDRSGARITGTSSGGGSEPILLSSTMVTANTTSTSATTLTTISLGASAWTSEKILYVKIRDTAGQRNGYFYGSDIFYFNYLATDGATGNSNSVALRNLYSKTTSGAWYQYNPATSTGYGVYSAGLTKAGVLTISARYNATYSKTINGTYQIDVYLVDYPVSSPYESEIPSAYEQVSCIGGSRSAYIETGLTMDGDYDWSLKVKLANTEGTKYQVYPISGYKSSSSRQGGRFDFTAGGAHRFMWFWVGKSTLAPHNIDSSVDLTDILTLEQDKTGLTITDENGNSSSVTYEGTTGTDTGEITLFTYLTTGVTDMIYIYSAKINKNGTVLRDFVPVRRKADSELGMYDKVNGVFYTKTGTGEFVVG